MIDFWIYLSFCRWIFLRVLSGKIPNNSCYNGFSSLRGRLSLGKGKGILGARDARGRREGRSLLPSPSRAVSRPNSLPLPIRTPATHTQATGLALLVLLAVDQSPNYLLCDMIIVKQFRYFVQYKSWSVSIQVKAFKQYFPVVLFIMLYFDVI